MFPKGTPDPEYSGNRAQSGTRLDGQNLVQKWLAKHQVTGTPGYGASKHRTAPYTSKVCAKTGCVPAGRPVCLEPHRAHPGLPGLSSDSPHG